MSRKEDGLCLTGWHGDPRKSFHVPKVPVGRNQLGSTLYSVSRNPDVVRQNGASFSPECGGDDAVVFSSDRANRQEGYERTVKE